MHNEQMADWMTVPRDVATRHPLFGLGGWMIGVMLCSALYAFNAATRLSVILRTDLSLLPPDAGALVTTQWVANLVLAIWGAVNILLILLNHRAFPASFVGWWLGFAAFLFGDLLTVQSYKLFAPEVSYARYLGRVVGTLLFASPWIPYLWMSRRANVTFRSRVWPDDPILR